MNVKTMRENQITTPVICCTFLDCTEYCVRFIYNKCTC